MARKWLQVILVVATVVLLLAGCGEETSSPPLPATQKVMAPPVPAATPESTAEIVGVVTPAYIYNPSGRRDPFEALTNVKQPVAQQVAALTPLEKVELAQLRLIGIITGKGEPRAMVVAPDGKSYILRKGIKVGRNEGTVVGITPEAVSVEERYYDFSGEIRKNIVSIQLPRKEGVE